MDICWYFWESEVLPETVSHKLFFADSVMKLMFLLNTPETDIFHIF